MLASFAHPERGLALAALALAAIAAGLAWRRRRRGPWLTALGAVLRGGALLALALLAAGPVREVARERAGIVLVAVDGSRSVGRAARRVALEAVRRAAGSHPVEAVLFGESARPLDLGAGGQEDPGAAEDGDLRSELAPALGRLALGPAAAQGAARLVVLTDGALPPPPAGLGSLERLAPLFVAPGGGRGAGYRARGLAVQGKVAPGEPLVLELEGESDRAQEVEVRVFADGALARTVRAALSAGPGRVALALPPPSPGDHLIAARVIAEGDDPLDNAAATWLRVAGRPKVLLLAEDARPLIADALRAQEIDVEIASPADPGWIAALDRAPVLVTDRVPASVLSEETTLARIRRHLDDGGGLLHVPPAGEGELFGREAKPFLELLPFGGRAPKPPEPPKEEPSPSPDETPPEGLAPPDPTRKKEERRLAPTLGLLLLVDASHSMKGTTLLLAKEAAIAASEVLHPEDHVGVIAFNEQANLVLELTKAGDKEFIADRIARIQAGGGTHFGRPLELARDLLGIESFAIKHVILLSDGESRPVPLKALVESMVSAGITVSTVGCGTGFNAQVLSDIAAWGRGKFQPAFSADEIPQVFTIEAERVIAAGGARRRPRPGTEAPSPKVPAEATAPAPPKETAPDERPPDAARPEPPAATPIRLALPAPYTRGIDPTAVPGVLGRHETDPRRGAWVAIETEDGLPVAGHAVVGEGRVVAWTLPLEHAWSAHLMTWDDYGVVLAQMVRFLDQGADRARFFVTASGSGRRIDIDLVDRKDRVIPFDDLVLELEDEAGRRPRGNLVREGASRLSFALEPTDPAAAVAVSVRAAGDVAAGRAFAAVAPPPELARAGADLPRLEEWATALGGAVSAAVPATLDVPPVRDRSEEPALRWLPLLVLALAAADLAIKRLFPGSVR